MAATAALSREQVEQRLRDDLIYFPENALQIVNARSEVVPFVLKRPQIRLARALMAQRAAGEPMRAIIDKSRKVGFSTQSQGMMIQRTAQQPNHLAFVVAQDNDTVGEVFLIGRGMWSRLPQSIRPELAYERNSIGNKYLHFGEPAQLARRQGIVGLDSRIVVQTAKVAAAGRGMTIRSLHMSEVAWWDYPDKKVSLLNAMPDDADTLGISESTPNGHNHWHEDWEAAVEGASGWVPIYTPWFEDPNNLRAFRTEEERGELEATLGMGKYGDDEPALLKLIPTKIREWELEWGDEPLSVDDLRTRVLEHLNWRRWAIGAKCKHDVNTFHQEYSSTPEEGFLSTGRKVFRPEYTARVIEAVQSTDPAIPSAQTPGPARGALLPAEGRELRAERGITIEVPGKAIWTPRSRLEDDVAPRWRKWAAPAQEHETVVDEQTVVVPAAQYVVACDPMSGEENEGAHAHHAIQVIDHRTLEQVAEYESQDDVDEVALQVFLAALHWNRALIVVEVTGGWGYPITNRISRHYRYPRLFERQQVGKRTPETHDQLGWSTDTRTKPELEARATELLRDEIHGVKSRTLALQMLHHVRDDRGRTGPEPGKLNDLLMAWMIAQRVAEITPLRAKLKDKRTTSTRKRGGGYSVGR